MGKFFDWFEHNYLGIVLVVCLSFAAVCGAVCIFDKGKGEAMVEWERAQAKRAIEKEEHRSSFFNEFAEYLPQFQDPLTFSRWLDDADMEAIILLHSVIEKHSDEFYGDEGFGYMTEYLYVGY